MSKRKPFNENAGYIASRKNFVTGSSNVLYDGELAGLDTDDGKERWQTVCEGHGAICSHRTLALARSHLPDGDWCEECMKVTGGYSTALPPKTSVKRARGEK